NAGNRTEPDLLRGWQSLSLPLKRAPFASGRKASQQSLFETLVPHPPIHRPTFREPSFHRQRRQSGLPLPSVNQLAADQPTRRRHSVSHHNQSIPSSFFSFSQFD